MALRNVVVGCKTVTISTEGDSFGEAWWRDVEGGVWEPSTIGWIETNVRDGCFFFDVGAASGLISILAALNGARVVAVEPSPIWHPVLERNFASNGVDVEILKIALASETGAVDFSSGHHRSVMTDINFASAPTPFGGTVKTSSLEQLIHRLPAENTHPVRLKMDIEGIEFLCLKNAKDLQALKKCGARMLVSLHPGFIYVNDDLRGTMLGKWNQRLARARGVLDCFQLFRRLRTLANVSLTNGSKISSALRFAALTRLGQHDFILDFGPRAQN